MNRTTSYSFLASKVLWKQINYVGTETELEKKRDTLKLLYQILHLLSMTLVMKFPAHVTLPTTADLYDWKHEVLKGRLAYSMNYRKLSSQSVYDTKNSSEPGPKLYSAVVLQVRWNKLEVYTMRHHKQTLHRPG